MIADHIIKFVLKAGREKTAKGEQLTKPFFKKMRIQVFTKWHEDYPEAMLEKLYWAESVNPKFREREVDEDYIDVNREVRNLRDAVEDLQTQGVKVTKKG